MRVKTILTFFLTSFFIFLLMVYFFIPLDEIDFVLKETNNNFTLNIEENNTMQFYPNMRFSTSNITYVISDCTVKKTEDMNRAFNIIQDSTVLKFKKVDEDGDISVLCDSSAKIEGGLYIAGEGGPSNVTQTDLFNVISKGKILLFKDSNCPTPNIALHELLHVLGFDHSKNKKNIMFPISDCRQTIGEDTIEYINKIYSIPGYPDLVFEDVKASFSGRYFDTQMQIMNQGLSSSGETEIIIYGDGKVVKKFSLDEMDYGYGRVITLSNIWVLNKFDNVKFVINSTFEEIDKNNNEAVMVISTSED